MNSGYTDPTPACGSNVPGTIGSGPAYWDGGGCSGQLISTVVGPPVSCLTLAYTAVNTDDYATLTVNGGGVVTITAVNCGVSGNVVGPFNCGTYFYGNCGVTICSTIPFSTVTLSNTGCSSGWVIDCATPLVTCVNPVITPELDVIVCAGSVIPLNSFVSTPAGTITWTNSNTSIGLGASGSGDVPAFTAVNATAAPITSTITVTSTNGACTGTDVYLITVNPQPTVNANIDQTICAGGTINLAGLIGGGASSATWSAPSGTFSNASSLTSTYTPSIASGTVTLTLTTNDPAGPCVASTDQMVVTVTAGATVNANVDQTICEGGIVTLAGSIGGTATSSTWSAPSGTFSNSTSLTSTYTPTITNGIVNLTLTTNDPAGPCLAVNDVMVVTVNPLATANANIDQTVCAGGTINLAGIIGGGATSAAWSAPSGTFSNSSSLTSSYTPTITSGTITLTLTTNDPAGPCLGTTDVMVVTVNPPATVNANIDQSVCAGSSITLAGSIGGGATSSTWTAPSGTFSNSTSLTSSYTPTIPSGTVTLTLTTNDPAGPCPAVNDVMIVTVNPLPAITVTGTNPTTCGGTDGTVTIAGVAASTGYSVTYFNGVIIGPAMMMSNGAGEIIISGLNNGTYSGFSVTLNGCISTSPTVIVLVDPSAPTVGAGIDQTVCQNTNTTLTATNPDGALISWDNGGIDGVAFLQGVGTITYTVTADLVGCISTDQVNVVVNPNPTVNDPADQNLCEGSNTTPVNFTGSLPGTIYDWTNSNATIGLGANGTGNIASFVAVNVGPTLTSIVTVTPSLAGCVGTPQSFNITVINSTPSLNCPGNLTAICSITEQPPYATLTAFTTAGGSASSIGSTIVPASFTLVSEISDGLSCPETVTRTYSIQDTCGHVATCSQTIIVDDNINPTGTAPANITVQCIGDVPISDVTAITNEADNCAIPTVTFISQVSDGNTCPEIITRTYRITDACGNFIDVVQTITVNDNINPTASNPAPINVSCSSNVPAPDPAVVTTEADNCTANPVVVFVSDLSDGNVCNNETITRTYSVTDNCGNSINITQQIIIGVTTPSVNAGPNQDVCEGIQVTLTASNPDAAVITWDLGVTNGVAFTPPVGTTFYNVTATQCMGECVSTDQVSVTVNPLPNVVFQADEFIGCEPFLVTFTNYTIPSGANCVWNFGDGGMGSGCDSIDYTYMTAGIYDVGLTITSLQGCTSSVTYPNYISVVETPIAAFTATPTIVPLENTTVEFGNESLYADSYYWDFGDNTTSTAINPDHTFPVIGNVDYVVMLIASNYLACVDTVYVQITVEDEIIFYVPNVFTPDADNINNTFYPVFTSGYDLYDYHLLIFNRWGEVLFESYDATIGWSGTYGDEGLVKDDVYIWQIDFKETMSDKRHTHRGHVTVLK